MRKGKFLRKKSTRNINKMKNKNKAFYNFNNY